MSFFTRWWRHYPDDQLAWLARQALAADAHLPHGTRVSVTSANGVLRLTGRVPTRREKERMEAAIRTALQGAGLPYRRLLNHLYVRNDKRSWVGAYR
jgi:hypothetical protein